MKQRMESIDIIRGITILLVVMAHSPENFIGHSILKNFRMPLFFIVSGYLFSFVKYNGNFPLLIKDKFRTLIIPYFSFAILGGLLWSIKHLFIDHDFSLSELLYGILNANGEFIKGNTPLWFLNCLFFTTIFFYITFHFTRKSNQELYRIIIFLILGLIGSVIGQFIWLPWSVDIALVAALFMFVGFYIKQYNFLQKIPLNSVSLLIGTIIFIITSFLNPIIDMNGRIYGNLLFFYLSGISGSFIVFWITEKVISKFSIVSIFFKNIGKDSIIILGLHMIMIIFFNTIASLLFNDFDFYGVFIIYSLLSIFLCKLTNNIILKSPILLYLFRGTRQYAKK